MPTEAKPLFRPDVLRPLLATFQLPERVASFRLKLKHWADLISSGRIDNYKEREILPDYLSDLFCGVLGYSGPAVEGDQFTFSREKHVMVESEYADAVLGRFKPGHNEFIVALEGKGPKDPLERPHAGRRLSAVEQAYRYAINLPCDWIIVTNIRQIRLYYKSLDQQTYELFETERLASDEAHLKKFLFLLAADRVIPQTGRAHFYQLLSASEKAGREITKAFYMQYANIRQDAFEKLREANVNVAPKAVLASTQKLLDRVLFIAFCEDRGLLPEESLKHAYEHTDPYNPRPIYENFRGLFRSINDGNKLLRITAYNGGLFALDPILDSMSVPNDVCGFFRDLGEYDYSTAVTAAELPNADSAGLVDVDLLGHVFEQSISDLEHLRNELDGLVEPAGKEKHKNRRKKEGAFYTPAFITRYIIQQTLGAVLKDRFEQKRQEHLAASKDSARKVLEDPAVYNLEELNKKQREALVHFWEQWQVELETIRLLDPACGSGAFLIEAFDQMLLQYQTCNQHLKDLRGTRTLFDPDRTILENNLYGVDLNEEAVEICRLSLWIKTAQSGKALTSLDHTIRVGNSVVDDAAVHPQAFHWRREFQEVFNSASAGFDVVIGNPPYIRQEWLAPYKAHFEKAFKSYHGVADIFTYFYELGASLLGQNGYMGFITSGSWVRGNFGAPLRKFLSENLAIQSIVDFGEYQPFEDAEMIRPSITVAKKQSPGGRLKLFKWLTNGAPPENLSEVLEGSPTMRTDHLNADAWELDPDEVLALRAKLSGSGTPLSKYSNVTMLYGVKTGLNDVFGVSADLMAELVNGHHACASIFRPFIQGTNLRSWHIDASDHYLIVLKSSNNYQWPWSDAGISAEKIFSETYPSIYAYLLSHKQALSKRQDQGRFWWELRSCDYWDAFEQSKIVWPDITNCPRFCLDQKRHYIGDSCFMIPTQDYFLLGVLSSWSTWFYISKTAQPLRLRSDRWQYRLKAQFMENVPIPPASNAERQAIADLALQCCKIGAEQYELKTKVQHRLATTFKTGSEGTLNQKAQAWWETSFSDLGTALKASFKLNASPFKSPRVADEWESYITEKRKDVERLSGNIEDAETELNDRVYRLFKLTDEEIRVLKREVEH